MIVMAVTSLGRCCPNTNVENADGGGNDDNGKEEYQKLMKKLIRRYIDDQADIDDAFRKQFERLMR